MKLMRSAAAVAFALIALLLPYRARARYLQALAWCAHAPFAAFGAVARALLRRLEPRPAE